MATLTVNTSTFIDSILPTFGTPRCNLPVWNEGDKMYISDEYESEAGNRYYKGLRFSNRLAIVEKVGLFHNWKYIDSIEVYTFDYNKRVLIGSHTFDKVFYDQALIQTMVKQMVSDYFESQMKLNKLPVKKDDLSLKAQKIVDETYASLLSDDYNVRFQQLLPILQINN